MTSLDLKANDIFVGKVVRKDMVSSIKGNATVPTYVLEYLLGQYCATSDEASRLEGIERVKEILREHYVHRQEGGLIRSVIREKGRHKVIDKVSVKLNEKQDCYEATFANLGIEKVVVDSQTVKKNRKLLVSGIWSIVDLEYEYTEDKGRTPWILKTLRPIQLSNFDCDEYLFSREKFTTEEWLDLLIQSLGFNPEFMNRRSKFLYLTRLIPYCERNYNIIELGPKGTGKSHVYSDFSPHGILISGGIVTVPKLFVNNSNGKLGLVGYWDCIAFDEFAGKNKKIKTDLVDIMKNYMANKTFSRAVETLEAEASFAFEGNTQHNVPFMLKHTNLFDDLPVAYQDTAFLDRIHYYLPGWEISILRNDMFTKGYGLIVDYLAEALRHFRDFDFMNEMDATFALNDSLTKRDKEGIKKTVSGLIKILYPNKKYTTEELRELVIYAVEGRKRVKDQLVSMDETFRKEKVHFSFEQKLGIDVGEDSDASSVDNSDDPKSPKTNEPDSPDEKEPTTIYVKTLEEKRYPDYYYRFSSPEEIDTTNENKLMDYEDEYFNHQEEIKEVDTHSGEKIKGETKTTTSNEKGEPKPTSNEPVNPTPANSTPTSEPEKPSADAPAENAPANDVAPKDTSKKSYVRQGTMGNFYFPNFNADKLKDRTIRVEENQMGFSFGKFFGPYFIGAKRIVIEDPYIHQFHQMKNLLELLETIISFKKEDEEIEVLLQTTINNNDPDKQKSCLINMQNSLQNTGVNFVFDFTANHDRHIWVDDKWDIFLGRGLDIFQYSNRSNPLDINNLLQTQRPCREFQAQITKVGKK